MVASHVAEQRSNVPHFWTYFDLRHPRFSCLFLCPFRSEFFKIQLPIPTSKQIIPLICFSITSSSYRSFSVFKSQSLSPVSYHLSFPIHVSPSLFVCSPKRLFGQCPISPTRSRPAKVFTTTVLCLRRLSYAKVCP